jgi:hypothetical protein
MKKSKTKFLIITAVIIIILIIACVEAYFYFKHSNPRFQTRNFQLNQSQIQDVTNFFDSSPSAEQIQTYCQQNRNCLYYCRNINSDNDYCKQLNSKIISGNHTRDNNTIRGGPGPVSRPPMPTQ